MKWWKQAVSATQEAKLPALVMGEFNQLTKEALVVIRLKDLKKLLDSWKNQIPAKNVY